MHRRLLAIALALLLSVRLAAPALPALAEEGKPLRLIRDAEIENTIRTYLTPILTASDLSPDAVKLYIVQDPTLNAFVAGGQNIFVNTGLLMKADNADEVIGVLAHETGHIVHGDVARTSDVMKQAQTEALIGMILGAAAAAATGHGGAGMAVVGAGQTAVMRSLIKYSQAQESAADQHAVTVLDDIGVSSRGMLKMFEKLQGQEFLITDSQDPWVRSHPLTSQRIEFIRNHVQNSPYSNNPLPAGWEQRFERAKAKLIGFLDPVSRVYREYPKNDHSIAARYARAIAYHRDARTGDAVQLIDGLIADEPNNPYFHELKGQILFESGHVREAVAPYQRAVDLAPHEALIRTALGAAQLETQDPAMVRPALADLKESSRLEDDIPQTWRLLATAYGRLGNKPMTTLSLAEEALLLGHKKDAARFAKQTIKLAERGSPAWLRAQDIERSAKDDTDDQ